MVERDVVPYEVDVLGVRVHLPYRERVERELAVGVDLVLSGQGVGRLVVVDLPPTVADLHEPVDEADDLVRLVEAQMDLHLEADGHPLVEGVVAGVVVAHGLLPDGPVVARAPVGARHPHVVTPFRVPDLPEAGDQVLHVGHAAQTHLLVQPLERVVHAAARERLDAVGPLRGLEQVGELVLLRTRLIRVDA
jgi:hypothetical protein